MSEEITLEEVLRLVSFENFDGGWAVKDVRGDVGGSVLGDVVGCVVGSVRGGVVGGVLGGVLDDTNKPTTPGEDVK